MLNYEESFVIDNSISLARRKTSWDSGYPANFSGLAPSSRPLSLVGYPQL